MTNVRCLCTMAIGGMLLTAVGCGQPKGGMAMSEMKGPPPRAAELDKLDSMIGTWDASFEMKMAGMDKPMTGKGTSHVEWQCDKSMVVEHVDGEMEGNPGKFHGMGIYTWDAHDKVYRMFWVDNEGRIEHGQMTMDDTGKTWQMKGKSHNTMTGADSTGKGTMKIVDNNTLEWTGTQFGGLLGMDKIMEMKGTSKRRM